MSRRIVGFTLVIVSFFGCEGPSPAPPTPTADADDPSRGVACARGLGPATLAFEPGESLARSESAESAAQKIADSYMNKPRTVITIKNRQLIKEGDGSVVATFISEETPDGFEVTKVFVCSEKLKANSPTPSES